MLNRQEIIKLIEEKELIKNQIDLDTQLTGNGIDLTVEKIYEFDSPGALDFSNKERLVPEGKELLPKKEKPEDSFGWWDLKKGAYKIKTNEIVNLPHDLVALAFTRTSLLRMGGFTQHGVWDAGFRGKGEFIIIVENPHGIRLKQNARVVQLVFLPIKETDRAYEGIYKHKS